MMVILSGAVSVEVGGRRVAELGEGKLIGEMSFVTDEKPNADVVAVERTRFDRQKASRRVPRRELDLRSALQGVIGADLAIKLRMAWRAPSIGESVNGRRRRPPDR